jgi:hypothetical protein
LKIELIVLNRIIKFRLVGRGQLEELGAESGLGNTSAEISQSNAWRASTVSIQQADLDKCSDPVDPILAAQPLAGSRALDTEQQRQPSKLPQISDESSVQGNVLETTYYNTSMEDLERMYLGPSEKIGIF